MTMGWILDTGVLLWIVIGGWLLLRRGPWMALRRIAMIGCGYGTAALAGWMMERQLRSHHATIVLHWLGPILVAMVGFLLGT